MRSALLVNPFGLGDVLFTTPVLRILKKTFPYISLTYMCNYRSAPLLEHNPYIARILPFSRGDIRKVAQNSKVSAFKKVISLLKEISKQKFDLLIDFSLDYRYSMLARILGIPRRIGFDYKGRGRFLTKKIEIEEFKKKHMVDYYLDLLKLIKIEKQEERVSLDLFLSSMDEQWAEEFLRTKKLEEKKIVGVIPGGGESWGEMATYKHWAREKFAEVADGLVSKYKVDILLLGSGEEKEICKQVNRLMHKKAIIVCGQTNIREFAALLKRCALIICNDGGPLHIAVSQKVPTISLFGPVDEQVYGPYPPADKHIVVKKDIACRPCYKRFKINLCRERRCLELISSQEVFQIAERVMDRIYEKRFDGEDKDSSYSHR
ncbi:MAG: hypothetical protein DRP75_01660 [Candidatus Omnitrophota bacterium]|nr:MAG: hypothetical protein DRP75_01660 [Candidatus Omnitrophota bacterium]